VSNVLTPKVLFVVERHGWCFANIGNALQRSLSEHFRFGMLPVNRIGRETCDVLVAFWWDHLLRAKANCKPRAAVTCLYDELSWHIDASSRAQFKLVLQNTDVLAVCNEGIEHNVREIFSDCTLPEIVLIEDGVDTELFQPSPLPDKLRIGWTGNSNRHTPGGPDDLKGLQMIRKAVTERAGVELVILDAAAGGSWPHKEMPKFYQQVSAVIIGSACEGTPNPLLEGLASGRPVISTRVGIAPKVIEHGVNGYLIDRSEYAMTSAVTDFMLLEHTRRAAMGRQARQSALPWSWEKKAPPWHKAIKLALDCAGRRPLALTEPKRVLAPIEVVAVADTLQSRREPHNPPKVLAISDVPDWAFHVNMSDMAEALKDEFQVDHWFVADWQQTGIAPDFQDYDTVFSVYHRWNINHILPWDRTVGSLRALWFFPEKPEPPGEREFALVNQYRAFHVVTKQNYEELRERCPHVCYLTNPVDMNRFPDVTPVEGELIASWNGNAKHRSGNQGDIKGFWHIVAPAAAITNCRLEYAEYNTKRLSPQEMPGFYQKSNVALCASLYEGASSSVMEAMASGLALITTDAGNAREMQQSQLERFNDTGIMIVERSIPAFVEALESLKENPGRIREMGLMNREEIAHKWSWSKWKSGYAEFLRKGFSS